MAGVGHEASSRMARSARSLGALGVLVATSSSLAASASDQPPNVETLVIDAKGAGAPFAHYWERMFGSGRATLSLRDSYRQDLRDIKRATGVGYIRFHGILDDDVGVYDEDANGKPTYNFSYVDQIYDGLLEAGVRPFVELSFMPRKLAQKLAVHEFWYRPIVSPPKSWDRYEELIFQFTRHLVERYGLDEVSQWYFEVWNEPNIDFWVGKPKEGTYYQLYDRAARAIKRVSESLRVGGPATARAEWVDRFIEHTVKMRVPLDFVSTHVYANDTPLDVFGTEETSSRRQMVCRAVKKVHDQVRASSRPDLPIHWSEFNASWKNEPNVTDALMMGPWLADTVRQCDGLVESLAYWTFSDVFEEQGVVKEPFYGGFGTLAVGGVKKPSYNAFVLLHDLGTERLASASDSALATRRADGTLVIALWNLVLPDELGRPKRVTLRLKGVAPEASVLVRRLDEDHGWVLRAYGAMGRPRYPTSAQLKELKRAAELPPAERATLKGGELDILLPENGLALVVVK